MDGVIQVTLDPRFTRLLQKQNDLQTFLLAKKVNELDPAAMAQFFTTQAFAAVAEIVEVADETHWKPWSVRPDGEDFVVSKTRYTGELADVFIFFMNMMLVGDVTMTELAQAVEAKQEKNLQRWLSGYNAKTTKCPQCRRSYDDEGVACYPEDKATEVLAFCEQTGEFVR